MLIAEPMRLTAITRPMPEARKSVEKSSGTYMNTRFEAADSTQANTANSAMIAIAGMPVQTVRTSIVADAIPKVPTSRVLRLNRSMTQQADDRSAEQRNVVDEAADVVALEVHRSHHLGYERPHCEVGNHQTREERAPDESGTAAGGSEQPPPAAVARGNGRCDQRRRHARAELLVHDCSGPLAIAVIRQPQRGLRHGHSERQHEKAWHDARQQHPAPGLFPDAGQSKPDRVGARVSARPGDREQTENASSHSAGGELNEQRLVDGVIRAENETDR